eukprot:4565502-Pleurochrysis_carterae.AAC.1
MQYKYKVHTRAYPRSPPEFCLQIIKTSRIELTDQAACRAICHTHETGMRVLLIAAVATVADAFSSVVPEEVCRPLRDCSLMPDGWVTQFTVSKRQYESTKTADE